MFRLGERLFRLIVCAGMMTTAGSILSPTLANAADNPKGIPASAEAFVVKDHIDGDTLRVEVEGDTKFVNLFGIDAPELGKNECFGQEARDRLQDLAPEGSIVYLEAEGDDKANSKNWQRNVWIEGKDGGKATLLNTKLVREGFAGIALDEQEDGKYFERLSEAEEKARELSRGLWGACGGVHEKVVPTPTPTPSVEEIKAQYAPLADVREMAIRPAGMMGQKIYFYGTIGKIQVATPGYVFNLGDLDPRPYTVWLQIEVWAPDGTTQNVSIGYDGDTAGMYEGTYVLVYGELVDVLSGTNAFGGSITQPLVAAQFVEFA